MGLSAPRLTLKNFFSWLAQVCSLGVAVIAIFIPVTGKARTAVSILAGVAIVSLFIQMSLQSADDRSSEKKLDRVANFFDKQEGKVVKTHKPINVGRVKTKDFAAQLGNDPRVYLEIKTEGQGLFSKTVFLLSNLGGDVAHKVQVEPLTLHSGQIRFDSVETIPTGTSKEILPTVENVSVFSRHNMNSILMNEWDAAGNVTSEFPNHIRILYEDFAHRQFETAFDLVYLPLNDIVQRNPFEIRNMEFRPLAETIS
jgi:hypothetical protein